jgi:hypothetical protein
MITHHLKGFHLALAAHQPGRNDEGWKLSESEWHSYLSMKVDKGELTQQEADLMEYKSNTPQPCHPPSTIPLIPHLCDDIYALREFFELPLPPEIQARWHNIHLLLYGFADASGGGLGSTVTVPGSGIRCRVGVWGKDEENESSNYKEFENVVLTIEEEARQGMLNGASMYLFTDNSTVEGALFKGNTPSRKLFNLIVRFRKTQMEGDADVIVSHVSGTQMIAQGTDGVSRGLLNEGVTSGIDMLLFIPTHLSAIERHPPIIQWIFSWLGNDAELLTSTQWFSRRHSHYGGYYDDQGFWRQHIKPGKFVWAPAPGAAEVAVEDIEKSTYQEKRLYSCISVPPFVYSSMASAIK